MGWIWGMLAGAAWADVADPEPAGCCRSEHVPSRGAERSAAGLVAAGAALLVVGGRRRAHG